MNRHEKYRITHSLFPLDRFFFFACIEVENTEKEHKTLSLFGFL